ncbi:hypothetical protein ON010_g2881 [Phytophthora cinnamomi]|nr:hypothetical protein ON010_g2881 [Phytophthora cinnamomi]
MVHSCVNLPLKEKLVRLRRWRQHPEWSTEVAGKMLKVSKGTLSGWRKRYWDDLDRDFDAKVGDRMCAKGGGRVHKLAPFELRVLEHYDKCLLEDGRCTPSDLLAYCSRIEVFARWKENTQKTWVRRFIDRYREQKQSNGSSSAERREGNTHETGKGISTVDQEVAVNNAANVSGDVDLLGTRVADDESDESDECDSDVDMVAVSEDSGDLVTNDAVDDSMARDAQLEDDAIAKEMCGDCREGKERAPEIGEDAGASHSRQDAAEPIVLDGSKNENDANVSGGGVAAAISAKGTGSAHPSSHFFRKRYAKSVPLVTWTDSQRALTIHVFSDDLDSLLQGATTTESS